MKVLAKALLRLDGLSHVLAWTKDPVLACKDPASLDFVELPRLRLRFEAKADGPGGKVLVCLFVSYVHMYLCTYVFRVGFVVGSTTCARLPCAAVVSCCVFWV